MPTPKAGGQYPVQRPQLLIQLIWNYPPQLEAAGDGPCCGDKGPPDKDVPRKIKYK
jgi:hypothetical protein